MLIVVCQNHHITGYNPVNSLNYQFFFIAHIGFYSVLEVVSYPFPETNSKFASENSNAFRKLLLAARSGYEMLKVELNAGEKFSQNTCHQHIGGWFGYKRFDWGLPSK